MTNDTSIQNIEKDIIFLTKRSLQKIRKRPMTWGYTEIPKPREKYKPDT